MTGTRDEQPAGWLAAEVARVLTELTERTRQVRPETVQQAVRAAGELATAVREVLVPASATVSAPADGGTAGRTGRAASPPLQHIDVTD